MRGGETGPSFFPTRKTAGTAWVITPPPLPNFSTKAPLQLFSPISLPLLSTTPTTAQTSSLTRKIISPKSFICITTYFHFRKQRECTRFQSLLHYTCDQNMHRRTGCCCTSTKPQMHHKGKATRQSQYSISPRTTAKLICKKIHCNVLF